jgi:flagellar basal body rod protein FlgB
LFGITGAFSRAGSNDQKLVASNIANADTPGYTTKDINFQSEYQSAIDGGDNTANVVELTQLPVKTDGNNVSLEREARLLSDSRGRSLSPQGRDFREHIGRLAVFFRVRCRVESGHYRRRSQPGDHRYA